MVFPANESMTGISDFAIPVMLPDGDQRELKYAELNLDYASASF